MKLLVRSRGDPQALKCLLAAKAASAQVPSWLKDGSRRKSGSERSHLHQSRPATCWLAPHARGWLMIHGLLFIRG